MNEQEPPVTAETLAREVEVLFGEDGANNLRHEIERNCPHLAIEHGTNGALLGFVAALRKREAFNGLDFTERELAVTELIGDYANILDATAQASGHD